MTARLKVSIVDFLNAAPLSWGFLQGHFSDLFRVTRDTPAACAAKLARGQADVGLIPSIAYQTIPGLTVLPRLAIAADGDVRSVLLLTRGRSLGGIRAVAADPASRTSVALMRILLQQVHGIAPAVTAASGDPRRLLSRFDAVLAIGDRALRAPTTGLVSHDLAGMWKRLTGLPFVFALWAVRPGLDLGDAAELFALSRALGWGDLDGIIAWARRQVALDRAALYAYFTNNLHYDLGPRERRGLERFYALARRHGILERVEPLRFHGAAPAR